MNTSVSRLFAIAVAAGIGMSAAPAFAAKVKITYATYLEPAHLSVFWPIMNGKIKSDTVEVEVKNLSIAATAQAMATKQYDIFEIGALSIEAAEKQGLELQMVGTGLRYSPDTRGFGVWVKADSKYQTMADLKGKKKEFLKNMGFDTIVTDEAHQGSSTDKTRTDILDVETEIREKRLEI